MAGRSADLASILQQGRFAHNGRDPLGDLEASEVRLLGAICPGLAVEDLGRRYRLCADIPRSSLIAGDGASVLADPGRAPERMCYLATHTDPFLGRASSFGLVVGQSLRPVAVEDVYGYGDLAYAAEILRRLDQEHAGGLSCRTWSPPPRRSATLAAPPLPCEQQSLLLPPLTALDERGWV